MRSLVFLLLVTSAFIHVCCNSSGTNKTKQEDSANKLSIDGKDSARIDNLLPEQRKARGELLLTASFTEPFMYAQIFEQEAVFTFPDKDTLRINMDFKEILNKEPAIFKTSQNNVQIEFKLTNQACSHPASGETWDRKAFCIINTESYSGCANFIKK